MSGRIFLANVGANASHRFTGPIFSDGTFEFIPIPETPNLCGTHAVRYKDLKSFYKPAERLTKYVPKRYWNAATHNDPEFKTFTYGDNCETTPRAASLIQMKRGDYLFFIVRLERWDDDAPTSDYGFYLIGYLEMEESLSNVRRPPEAPQFAQVAENAHVRRGLTDPSHWDGFWVFRGSERSQRFRRAVPVTRELADNVFTAADGSPWRWDGNRSELQVIGSYTRSCRCVIDPGKPGGAARAKAFWTWVERHS